MKIEAHRYRDRVRDAIHAMSLLAWGFSRPGQAFDNMMTRAFPV